MSGLGYRIPMPASSIGATANYAAASSRARNGSSFLPSPVRRQTDLNIAKQSFNQFGTSLQTRLPYNSATQSLPNFGSTPTFGEGYRVNAPLRKCVDKRHIQRSAAILVVFNSKIAHGRNDRAFLGKMDKYEVCGSHGNGLPEEVLWASLGKMDCASR